MSVVYFFYLQTLEQFITNYLLSKIHAPLFKTVEQQMLSGITKLQTLTLRSASVADTSKKWPSAFVLVSRMLAGLGKLRNVGFAVSRLTLSTIWAVSIRSGFLWSDASMLIYK